MNVFIVGTPLETAKSLDKKRLKEKMGILDPDDMYKIDKALSVSFGLTGTTFPT